MCSVICRKEFGLRGLEWLRMTLELLFSCRFWLFTAPRLGQLFVLGPAPLAQDRSCVSGQTCYLSGFTGDLNFLDELRIMDTCGVESVVPRVQNWNSQVSNSGAAVFWAEITAAGGQYRLCWRSGTISSTSGTSDPDPSIDFAVDIGKLNIIGPTPLEQERTCVSGQTCILTGINGYLSETSKWRVLATCGVPSLPFGIGTDLIVEGGNNWLWESTISALGGEYRLCWCHGNENRYSQSPNSTVSTESSNTTNRSNQSLESQALKLVEVQIARQIYRFAF